MQWGDSELPILLGLSLERDVIFSVQPQNQRKISWGVKAYVYK